MLKQTRIRKDPSGGWLIEVFYGTGWHLKRWVAGNKRDAIKAEREVEREVQTGLAALHRGNEDEKA